MNEVAQQSQVLGQQAARLLDLERQSAGRNSAGQHPHAAARAAAFRIDWPEWLKTRTQRDRRIIQDMALSERTQKLARRYGISPGRVSQLRREYCEDWKRFRGEDARAMVVV